ncbi:MAG: LptF/LptG family permease [Gemmatimonadales bacterium]
MIGRILDRYLLEEWFKIFTFTTVGFPLIVILLELTDNLDDYLARGITPGAIALGYLFSLPDKLFLVLPAAVLFATIFSLGSMSRHSELTAAKAAGRSFQRTVLPIVAAAMLATGAGIAVGQLAPSATRRQLELHGELEKRSTNSRQNFVYRAEEGWVYSIRSLNVKQQQMANLVLEREGSGANYPTIAVQARIGTYDPTTARWTLRQGRMRMIAPSTGEVAFKFDSLRLRNLTETPADLLVEPKKPEEMTYSELGGYIEALERSGGDGRQLRVDQALKISVPFTCFIIAIFGAPLAITAPRASGALGVALALGTTLVFLVLMQMSRAIGGGGILPPAWAAWAPNIAFGLAGLWLLKRARS